MENQTSKYSNTGCKCKLRRQTPAQSQQKIQESQTDNASFIGVSKTPAASKMEFFLTLVSGCKPLTNITKNACFDVAGVSGTSLSYVGLVFFDYSKLTKSNAPYFK